jgi:DNA-binding PadR family transcriptional regulator
VLLALLGQRPMHGYEMMAELARLFPQYRPSPGTVYPAIEALDAEGLIEGAQNGGRTTYGVTPAGEQAVKSRADALAALELRTGARLGADDSLAPVLDRFRARVVRLNGRVDTEAVEAVLERAAGEIEALNSESKVKEAQ